MSRIFWNLYFSHSNSTSTFKKKQKQKKNIQRKMSTATASPICQLRSKPPNQEAFYPLQTKQLLQLPSASRLASRCCLFVVILKEERLYLNIIETYLNQKKMHYSYLFNIKWVSLYFASTQSFLVKKNQLQTFTPHQLAVLAFRTHGNSLWVSPWFF